MTPDVLRLIEALHRAGPQCALALTGGGASAAAMLLGVPGASRTVLEVVVPYHERSFVEYLGHTPAQFCSAETARALADRAFARAARLAPEATAVGLGCTASLATDRPKRGAHRFFVTVRTATARHGEALILAKGQRDRAGEEAVLAAVLLNAVAAAFGVAGRVPVPLLPGEALQSEPEPLPGAFAGFLRGESAVVCQEADGRWHAPPAPPSPMALLCGSFNPLHEGHLRLAAVAERHLGLPTAFELSIANVDKPELSAAEVRRRAAPFVWKAPLWLTRAPTFVEKARRFPGSTFVVGADTATRIVAPRYYQDDPARLRAALNEIRDAGCRFLVGGRCEDSGRFYGLEGVPVPEGCGEMFAGVAEAEFRVDLSSTQLRARLS